MQGAFAVNLAGKDLERLATVPAHVASPDSEKLATMPANVVKIVERECRFWPRCAFEKCHPFGPRVRRNADLKRIAIKNFVVTQLVKTSKSSHLQVLIPAVIRPAYIVESKQVCTSSSTRTVVPLTM